MDLGPGSPDYTALVMYVAHQLRHGQCKADMRDWLSKQGVPVKFANPKEGALTWSCGLVLLKNAPHPDKGYDLIDAMLDPRAGKYLIEQFGYGHSNRKSFELVAEADLLARGLSANPMEILGRGKFAGPQTPEVDQAVTRDYEKIQAGF